MYVDGFILALPEENIGEYKKFARKAGKIWIEHGAVSYVESIADDVKPGKLTSFPQAVKQKDGELVVFSWVTYKSKADRNRISKLVMNDPRLKGMDGKMPFDGKRMIYGGFKAIVEL